MNVDRRSLRCALALALLLAGRAEAQSGSQKWMCARDDGSWYLSTSHYPGQSCKKAGKADLARLAAASARQAAGRHWVCARGDGTWYQSTGNYDAQSCRKVGDAELAGLTGQPAAAAQDADDDPKVLGAGARP